MKTWKSRTRSEKGAILFLVAAGMVVFLGLAGLALDLGMLYTVKSELQNAVDAAALAGASQLNGAATGINQAVTEAVATVNKYNFNNTAVSVAASDVTFSATRDSGYVDQATAAASPANIRFVRVNTQKTMELALIRVIPGVGTTRGVSASAVAGKSPPINVVCDGLNPLTPVPFRNPDGSLIPYVIGQEYTLKFGPGCQNPEPTDPTGPGNFLILDFSPVTGTNSGAAAVQELLEGGAAGCIGINDTICTKTGSATGPIEKGINSRFSIQPGQSDDTRDSDTRQGITYSQYATDGLGNGRRILPVPIISKTPPPVFTSISQSDLDTQNTGSNGKICGLYIYDLSCFFIRNPVPQGGGGGGNCADVRGEFIGSCPTGGGKSDPTRPGPGGAVPPSLTRLVLYR